MSALLQGWAIFVVAIKRLLTNWWLALATTLGLIVSLAVIMSIPLYADGVYHRVLREKLTEASSGRGSSPSDLPLSFGFRYIGSRDDPLQWEDVKPADDYLKGAAAAELGLPRRLLVRHLRTDKLQLFPQEDVVYADIKKQLAWVNLGFMSDLEDHVTILEGEYPPEGAGAPGGPVDVLLSESLAAKLGLQVGETYVLFASTQTEEGRVREEIPVRIAGVWRASDPQAEYWVFKPVELGEVLIVREEAFLEQVAPRLREDVEFGAWYLVMEGSELSSEDVEPLLSRTNQVRKRVSQLLPGAGLAFSPVEALLDYRESAQTLTALLYVFSVPVLGLTLAFIGLVAALSVGRRRNEIATLRSRGATSLQIAGIAALEALILGVIALAAGVPTGEGLAWLMGRARSFMDFGAPAGLRVGVTEEALRFGAAALGLVLITQIAPSIGAARYTIVTYKRERARAIQAPWWQRAWLDILLLIPVVYGAYLMRQQGGLALPMAGRLPDDPFQNPLLLLVPSLGIFAATLFILRILPTLMAGLAWVVGQMKGVGVLLAARHLARTPRLYSAPLVLLVVTLSLSTFTASLAETLDGHLRATTYYQVGADMNLVERGGLTDSPGGGGGASGGGSGEGGAQWLFLPVTEHLKVPGVEAAARVGRYEGTAQLGGSREEIALAGVDRLNFAEVAFWREDFAGSSLGSLMNALAVAYDGALISGDLARANSLKPGDVITIMMKAGTERPEMDLRIVGTFERFPTWYPGEADGVPLLVANLDYVFDQVGGQLPYDVWLRTDEGADYEGIVEGVSDLGLWVTDWEAAPLEILRAQVVPARQGLFGLLSVGFLAAALLTVLGFLLYAIFSFRSRFIELGTLRAIGLSSGQMTAFLASELAFLIGTGMAAGTALGVGVSAAFIPYLQVSADASGLALPIQVAIAWPEVFRIYALFGALFVIALVVLVALLRRMRVFQAIKLGEAA